MPGAYRYVVEERAVQVQPRVGGWLRRLRPCVATWRGERATYKLREVRIVEFMRS
jgi:hypothetical protein